MSIRAKEICFDPTRDCPDQWLALKRNPYILSSFCVPWPILWFCRSKTQRYRNLFVDQEHCTFLLIRHATLLHANSPGDDILKFLNCKSERAAIWPGTCAYLRENRPWIFVLDSDWNLALILCETRVYPVARVMHAEHNKIMARSDKIP